MEKLINQLVSQGYLKTPHIIKAFKKIDRADFVLPEFRNSAEANVPLPIGYSQTISQPLTVAFMLELLQPKKGDKILDIGSGSGWTTALLVEIADKEGKVFAIELIPELCKFGEGNVRKYFSENSRIAFLCINGSKGHTQEAPYDKILVSASADKMPQELKNQLKINGRLVIPIKNSIWLIERTGKNKFVEKEFYGFSFVPLINKDTRNRKFPIHDKQITD